jgi:SAM-dependent methyltransferase
MSSGAALDLPRSLRDRLQILACPACGGGLAETAGALRCAACGVSYAIRNGRIYFTEPPRHDTQASNIKDWLRRRLGTSYNRLVHLVGPGLSRNKRKLLLEYIDPRQHAVVDLGSGSERVHPDVITLDLFDYPQVDIVCDLRSLPFGAASVDAFITASVLEHVEDVPALIEKMFACTREGGIGIHSFPFLFPFHEAPRDFIRFTHMGAASLFGKWRIRRLFNAAGPVTLFNTVTVELLSTLLSFGSGRAKEAFYLALCMLFFPLKYLDLLFVDRPRFLSVSAILCVIVEKPATKSD